MLAFLRDSNTSKSLTDIFDMLHQKLGHELFKTLYPVILTDSGSEFSNTKAVELGSDRFTVMPAVPPKGDDRSKPLTDAQSPSQKNKL